MFQTSPEVVTESDYDNYFTSLVQRWLQQKGAPYRSSKIVITAGPYRADAVTAKRIGTDLHLDFYSALRTGFGFLSNKEIESIKSDWL